MRRGHIAGHLVGVAFSSHTASGRRFGRIHPGVALSQSPMNPAFRSARLARGWHSQADVAAAYAAHAAALGEPGSIDVRQVRRWESAKPGWPNTHARRILAAMFQVPLEDLGFRPPHQPGREPVVGQEDAVDRRSFLNGVLGVSAGPLLGPPDQDRLAAALTHARRYTDHSLVAHLRAALDETARTDGSTGPRQALPAAMELLAVIDHLARDAAPAVRRELLVLGARAAEFTAWLHRDAGSPPHHTLYFHDRAIEWATITGDSPMHAYVLLRKAQATDRHDPVRMLDLAHTAARGPWTLPPRAQAEALQQEARALALNGASPDTVTRSLDEARHALDKAQPAEPASCTGPLCAGYTLDRLVAQTAISHREAGQASRAGRTLPAAPRPRPVRPQGPGVLHRPPLRRPRRRRRARPSRHHRTDRAAPGRRPRLRPGPHRTTAHRGPAAPARPAPRRQGTTPSPHRPDRARTRDHAVRNPVTRSITSACHRCVCGSAYPGSSCTAKPCCAPSSSTSSTGPPNTAR